MLGFLDGWSGGTDVMIKSIVNEYHWPPNIINEMYCDDFDYKGIKYWYDNLKEMHKKLDNGGND